MRKDECGKSGLSDDWYITKAKEDYQHLAPDGDIDFDDVPTVSRNDEETGAFVQAWVWVPAAPDKEDQ